MVRGKPNYKGPPLELQCVNTIRAMSADQVQAANSGHPGEKVAAAVRSC
jgi:transketolase